MDYFKIGALKVFADLGALIEQDECNKTKFVDLPSDIIQNNILSHLKKDKTINKIFHNQEDYFLQELLTGKIEKLTYVKPDEWNEYKSNLNFDCIKNYINNNPKFFETRGKVNILNIKYRVTNKLVVSSIVVKAYDDKSYFVSTNISNFVDDKECNHTLKLLKEEIKNYIKVYKS